METLVRATSETSENVDVRGRPSPLMQNPKLLRTWAGHGSGATCDGCGGLIGPDQIEYEIELPQGSETPSLYFHFGCYRNWTARGGIR
jgi:hypothetical protein